MIHIYQNPVPASNRLHCEVRYLLKPVHISVYFNLHSSTNVTVSVWEEETKTTFKSWTYCLPSAIPEKYDTRFPAALL